MNNKGFSIGIAILLGSVAVLALSGGLFWTTHKKPSESGINSTSTVVTEQNQQALAISQYDSEPFDDSDLKVAFGTPRNFSNDCYGLGQISTTSVSEYAKYLPSKENNAMARNAVKQYAREIDQFLASASATSPDSCLSRTLVSLSVMKGSILAIDKQKADAQKVFKNILSIAQQMQQKPGSTVDYLLAQSIKTRAIDVLVALKQQKIIDPRDYRTIVRAYADNKEGEKAAIRGEYSKNAQFIDDMVNKNYAPYSKNFSKDYFLSLDKARSDHAFQPNNTKKLFYQLAKAEMANVERPCGTVFTSNLEQFAIDPNNTTIENYIGKIIYSTQAIEITGGDKSRCALEKKFADF